MISVILFCLAGLILNVGTVLSNHRASTLTIVKRYRMYDIGSIAVGAPSYKLMLRADEIGEIAVGLILQVAVAHAP